MSDDIGWLYSTDNSYYGWKGSCFLLTGYPFTVTVGYLDNCFNKFTTFCSKISSITSPFAVMNCKRCLYKQHWCFYRLFCTIQAYKPSSMVQDTYQLPFYCNFDFTCLVSAHAQTLNKYLDTKKQIQISVFDKLI